MITVSIPSGKTNSRVSVKSATTEVLRRVIEKGLRGIRSEHFKFNAAGFAQLCKEVEKNETQMRADVTAKLYAALEELRRLTPVDTGAARDGWALQVSDTAQGVHYTIVHDNPKLINMLNFGTKPHKIAPKQEGWLVFQIGNSWIKCRSVNHPGTRALGFVDKVRNKLLASLEVKK